MGLLPDALPGYQPVSETGMPYAEMLSNPQIKALYVMGANPARHLAQAPPLAPARHLAPTPPLAPARGATTFHRYPFPSIVPGQITRITLSHILMYY